MKNRTTKNRIMRLLLATGIFAGTTFGGCALFDQIKDGCTWDWETGAWLCSGVVPNFGQGD